MAGPVLLSIFVNDLKKRVHTKFLKSADGTKLFPAVQFQGRVIPEITNIGKNVADTFKAEKYVMMQKYSKNYLHDAEHLASREDTLEYPLTGHKIINWMNSGSQEDQ